MKKIGSMLMAGLAALSIGCGGDDGLDLTDVSSSTEELMAATGGYGACLNYALSAFVSGTGDCVTPTGENFECYDRAGEELDASIALCGELYYP